MASGGPRPCGVQPDCKIREAWEEIRTIFTLRPNEDSRSELWLVADLGAFLYVKHMVCLDGVAIVVYVSTVTNAL